MAHTRPIDKEFEEADDTGVLDLSGRNLRNFPQVPKELLEFSDVFHANFSKNRFDRLPLEMISFKSLQKLNCYHNSLRYIPEELYLLTNLRHLDISRNFLQTLPPELCRMDLEYLNLSNNRLVSVPLELGKISKLQYLDLSCNMLQELPPSLCSLSVLEHLDIHRNELRDLPQDIYLLRDLIYLDVSGNYLNRLPTSVRLLEFLSILNVADNPMESPPTQVCVRGLVHIWKYLEGLEKKGSDPHLLSLTQRDESLRRRKEQRNKRNSHYRPMSESMPIQNGRDNQLGLLDEIMGQDANMFRDGELTPTGGPMHWSIAQFMSPGADPSADESKEQYREAAYRLYKEQQKQQKEKSRLRQMHSSSPPPESNVDPSKGSSQFNTLPKRRAEFSTSTPPATSRTGDKSRHMRLGGGGPGRSLPNEKQPRSGSWNSHMRISSPVLPGKYCIPPDRSKSGEQQSENESKLTPEQTSPMRKSAQSKSATDLHTVTPDSPKTSSPNKKRPPPLSAPQKSPDHDSDREGSITPTNEAPPTEDLSEEPTTPKGQKVSQSLDNLLDVSDKEIKTVTFCSAENIMEQERHTPSPKPRPLTPEPQNPTNHTTDEDKPPAGVTVKRSTSLTDEDLPRLTIESLEASPPSQRKHPSVSDSSASPSPDATWPRLRSPRKKKERDVFRFLKESDPNYTVRRQQLQMNLILEKNKDVKQRIETLMDVELSSDIGEWVIDGGVLLCGLINKLYPGTISTVHKPSAPGLALSGPKQTMNIAAFIQACRVLKVPEDELCSAGDLTDMKDPVRVLTCLQRVLEQAPHQN